MIKGVRSKKLRKKEIFADSYDRDPRGYPNEYNNPSVYEEFEADDLVYPHYGEDGNPVKIADKDKASTIKKAPSRDRRDTVGPDGATYHSFGARGGADFVDTLGRQYQFPDETDEYMQTLRYQGDITDSRHMMYVRIPIRSTRGALYEWSEGASHPNTGEDIMLTPASTKMKKDTRIQQVTIQISNVYGDTRRAVLVITCDILDTIMV